MIFVLDDVLFMSWRYCNILYICIWLFCSCTGSHKQKSNALCSEAFHIHLDFTELSDTLFLSSFVDSVEEKSLVLPDSLFLGEAVQVYLNDTNIFVVDWRQNSIYRFDVNGQFLNCINRLGEGPEEYLCLNKMWVYNDVLCVHDSKGLKVNFYTLEGDFKGSLKCENHFSDIEMLSDDSFLCFTPIYIYDNPTGLWLMDRQGKFKSSLFSYDYSFPSISILWNYFYRTSNGNLGVFSPGNDSFFLFANDTIAMSAIVDCVQHTSASFAGTSSCWDVKEDFYNLPWFIDGNKWLFMCYSHFKGNEAYYVLYSKSERKSQIYKFISVDVGKGNLLGHPVCSNKPDCLVTLTPDDYLDRMMGNNKESEAINSSLLLKIYHFSKE